MCNGTWKRHKWKNNNGVISCHRCPWERNPNASPKVKLWRRSKGFHAAMVGTQEVPVLVQDDNQ